MTAELESRRDGYGEITRILLGDLWGLDRNNPRLVARGPASAGMENHFCMVGLMGGEVTKQPCTAEQLRAYLNGDNQFKKKFKYLGRAKDYLAPLVDQKTRDEMADILVWKEGMKFV